MRILILWRTQMTNKMKVPFNLNALDKVPDIVLNKHGWVVLALPAIFYAIDVVRDLSSEAMGKGYNLTINFKDGNLSLSQAHRAS